MKTVLFIVLLGFGVTGLQGGESSAEAGRALAAQWDAALAKPIGDPNAAAQAKILAELKKQTAIMESQKPLVIYDPTVKTVPVTQVPVR
jgi:hypothetical protein